MIEDQPLFVKLATYNYTIDSEKREQTENS